MLAVLFVTAKKQEHNGFEESEPLLRATNETLAVPKSALRNRDFSRSDEIMYYHLCAFWCNCRTILTP